MARRISTNKEMHEGAAMWFASVAPVTQFLISGVIVVACFVATALAAKAAEMKIDRDGGSIYIDITGEITDHDAEELQKLSSELEYAKHFSVYLHSTGGNVSAAIKIGRLIRKYDGWTGIRANAKCYSSCALIFIAGVQRLNLGGELGIHRPYFTSAPQAREALEKAVPVMLSMLKSYIADRGSPIIFIIR